MMKNENFSSTGNEGLFVLNSIFFFFFLLLLGGDKTINGSKKFDIAENVALFLKLFYMNLMH